MKTTIMVVDDEEGIRSLARIVLEGEGYDVIEAASGAALREAFAGVRPDVMLLDLHLPDAHGLTLLPEVKKNWPGISVIILTGYGTVAVAEKAYQMDDVFLQSKPFDAGVLKALVEMAVMKKTKRPGAG